MPSLATWLSGQLGIFQTHASFDIVAACAGFPYGLGEAVRLLQEVRAAGAGGLRREVLRQDRHRPHVADDLRRRRRRRWSSAPPRPARAPDVEVLQTYASGPVSEVNSIIWPNPEFDNNITVYGPEVKALVKRYLVQMIDELRTLPGPDGGPGSLLDAIDLIVPHQANKTMVVRARAEAGLAPERLYFNIDRVGNVSAASIPIAIYDAVADGRHRPADAGLRAGLRRRRRRRLRGPAHRPGDRRAGGGRPRGGRIHEPAYQPSSEDVRQAFG